jgi:hypothetical protein
MNAHGILSKMDVSVDDGHNATYRLALNGDTVDVNSLIGQQVSLHFDGVINCIACNSETPKSYRQGYCHTCSTTLQEVADCRLRPELCDHNSGTCANPHFVYLSFTGNTKVGITRHISEPVSPRWIDQGAVNAMPIIETKNRLLSGLVELLFKEHVSDRTDWRLMLSDMQHSDALSGELQRLRRLVQPDIDQLNQEHGEGSVAWLEGALEVSINYPVEAYPSKIQSHNLDKTPVLSGVLRGVKGQYWIFDDVVINIRKYTGYNVKLTSHPSPIGTQTP